MKIVILAGGISTERDVSLVSGTEIYKALKSKGHNAVLLDVYLGYDGDPAHIFEQDTDWAGNMAHIATSAPDIDAVKASRGYESPSIIGRNVIEVCQEADIVFMALHGDFGENGKLQAAFDLMGIRYTGTDSFSASLAMDNIPLTRSLRRTRTRSIRPPDSSFGFCRAMPGPWKSSPPSWRTTMTLRASPSGWSWRP